MVSGSLNLRMWKYCRSVKEQKRKSTNPQSSKQSLKKKKFHLLHTTPITTVARTLLSSFFHCMMDGMTKRPSSPSSVSPASSPFSVIGTSRPVPLFHPQLCDTPNSSRPELKVVILVPIAVGLIILK